MFFKIGALKSFAIFTGKHLCWSHLERLQHRCFPVKFAKFLRTPFLQNTSSGYLFPCKQNMKIYFNWSNVVRGHRKRPVALRENTFSDYLFSLVDLDAKFMSNVYLTLYCIMLKNGQTLCNKGLSLLLVYERIYEGIHESCQKIF